MPAHALPPTRQQRQPAAWLPPLASSGNGSLNRSKMTALLPLNVRATERQNVTDCARSGMGFWQVARAEVHIAHGPEYAPAVQCRSRIATMPLRFSSRTYAATAR